MTFMITPCACGHPRYRHYPQYVVGGVAHPCSACECVTYQAAGEAQR